MTTRRCVSNINNNKLKTHKQKKKTKKRKNNKTRNKNKATLQHKLCSADKLQRRRRKENKAGGWSYITVYACKYMHTYIFKSMLAGAILASLLVASSLLCAVLLFVVAARRCLDVNCSCSV
ncbi:unnamed protein product [Ceratitis capitata]|uniref:(Mediterranean fruit fly) hypothetical protein n=1 Tax=Ceratitis capitata TaxID=7213 RepID=A0A811U134_CERCA|nr:unnamed protein product [Ceratitis capitata]